MDDSLAHLPALRTTREGQVLVLRSVRAPVASGISKPVFRHISQDVCPYNTKFAEALKEPEFASREELDSPDARTLAREFLTMSRHEVSARFKGGAMKRAKRRGLARNAAVVLGNAGTSADAPLLQAALLHDEPLVREHAAWAPGRIGFALAASAPRHRVVDESVAEVRD